MKKELYKETGYPGIKQRISDNMYIVTIDLGRQLRLNKKTGLMEMKQAKTTKHVTTLKEAKALLGKNNKEKKERKVTEVAEKVPFIRALAEYTAHYKENWSDSYMMQKQSQAKRMQTYFGNRDVKSIDTLDIEEFFKWCRSPQPGFPQPLSNNSIQKIRTHLKDFWRYMKKNQNRYGITENVVLDADYGEVQVFKGNILNAEQVNYMLQFAINYEADYSVWSMIGFTVLTGMRRGELCGIKWRNIDFENRLIDVEYQRCQISTGSIEKVPKKGNDDGHTREERKQRFSEFLNRVNKARGKDGLEPLPYVRLHDMRHTFISLCLNGGVNRFQVSANCGHTYSGEDNNTTVSTYWHDDGNRSEIIGLINQIIQVNIE